MLLAATAAAALSWTAWGIHRYPGGVVLSAGIQLGWGIIAICNLSSQMRGIARPWTMASLSCAVVCLIIGATISTFKGIRTREELRQSLLSPETLSEST